MTATRIRIGLLASIVAATLSTAARAQCEPQWLPGNADVNVYEDINAFTSWDPDGPGPLPPQLIIAGEFATAGAITANNIARWNSAAWQPFASGVDGPIHALTTWDPDGPGPAPALLVAAGDFLNAGGAPASRIAAWDGASWQPVGPGLDNTVLALASWDPDGPGPATPLLIAGGVFLNAGPTPVARIAAWNGTSWTTLGPGFSGTTTPAVRSLATWDPDGPGPAPLLLYAGGNFISAGATTVNSIASWDGAAWSPLLAGVTTASNPGVLGLVTWDPDGPGPLNPQLVLAGDFSVSGSSSFSSIVSWDGSAWHRFPYPTLSRYPDAIAVADLDGPGPMPERLVMTGRFGAGLSQKVILGWTGSEWETLDLYGQLSAFTLRVAGTLDPDGDGPRAPQLVVAGSSTFFSSSPEVNPARWENGRWQPLGSSFDPSFTAIGAMTIADPDADGPLPEQIIAAGRFSSAGSENCNGLARWDGTAWHAFAPLLSDQADLGSITSWDPDGPGPLQPLLVVAGSFSSAGGVAAKSIAAWSGYAWQALGSGFPGSQVYSLTSWDPDGPGPLQPLLIAGGIFSTAGGVAAKNIAAWNGSTWSPVGPGLNTEVDVVASWDPDGPGPQLPQLLAGGFFTVPGTSIHSIARWDGSSWTQMGQPLSIVYGLHAADLDGPGPLPTQLFAAVRTGGTLTNTAYRWDDPVWTPVFTSVRGYASQFGDWDPDGPGPLNPQLVAVGDFDLAGGVVMNNIARWDTAQWSPLQTGLTGGSQLFAGSVLSWDPDGPGPHAPHLFAGGVFKAAGDQNAMCFAHWGSPAPWFAVQPKPYPAATGADISLSATPAAGLETRGPAFFRWRRGGVPLLNGPTPAGSIVAGADTPTLFIYNTQTDDRGEYDCVMTAPCGSATTRPAGLTVTGCPVDFNDDGIVDFSDYLDFLNYYDALDPRVDLNPDGVIDFGDYLEFLNHYDAGC